jgi:hypothetical protein
VLLQDFLDGLGPAHAPCYHRGTLKAGGCDARA